MESKSSVGETRNYELLTDLRGVKAYLSRQILVAVKSCLVLSPVRYAWLRFEMLSTATVPTESPSGGEDVSFDNLYPALIECFAVILCGYVYIDIYIL